MNLRIRKYSDYEKIFEYENFHLFPIDNVNFLDTSIYGPLKNYPRHQDVFIELGELKFHINYILNKSSQ